MRQWHSTVENLKCGGCEYTVKQILLSLPQVIEASADASTGLVSMKYEGDIDTEQKALGALKLAGYSSVGESSLRDKAVSYVSCMKGKLAKERN